MWPWQKAAREVADERRRAEHAGHEVHDAEIRHEVAQKLAERSRDISAALRREIDKNGFTELLQQAMGGR